MAKLRHIALSVPDPEATAKFFMETFDMEQVGTTESPLSSGIYLSDGTICMAVLNYKDDALAGTPGGKDEICVNHFGFWVDDLEKADEEIIGNGGSFFLDLPADPDDQDSLYYEKKYRDPNGIIIDITAHGWPGAVKDVIAEKK